MSKLLYLQKIFGKFDTIKWETHYNFEYFQLGEICYEKIHLSIFYQTLYNDLNIKGGFNR